MLPPAEFGTYLAVGTRKRSRGQALFFDLKSDFRGDQFDLAGAAERCVPHPDGQPKHSVYLAIYRVLEHVPLAAINSLWLVTRDGRNLELEQAALPQQFPGRYHLYQELCPVHPLIASSLTPAEFCSFITDPGQPISVPRICFVDLQLAGLADDPGKGNAKDLPYEHLDHLRDCLASLSETTGKHTKTVDRVQPEEFRYRCVNSGFFVGDRAGVLYFPFPSAERLDREHHDWWRSATNL
jgi:hypothetical protein